MIHPFRVGDVFLVHRLGRQATRLNTIHALLQPYSAFRTSLLANAPWNDDKLSTYVLRQQGHELAKAGYLQARKRSRRPESDILVLAPGLDKPWGHPAIWEKLLSSYIHEATQHNIARIFVDAPDQPLPVTTLEHVGFRVYTRQSIWRLPFQRVDSFKNRLTASIRRVNKRDEWALLRLYARVTPQAVQRAEGALGGDDRPPILDCTYAGSCASFVLEKDQEIHSCIQIVMGRLGYWLQLWADHRETSTNAIEQLLCYALTHIKSRTRKRHVYIGVCDFQGGVGPILSDFGFAPFTDRARMVKHMLQWIREPVKSEPVTVESVLGAVPSQFARHGGHRTSSGDGNLPVSPHVLEPGVQKHANRRSATLATKL